MLTLRECLSQALQRQPRIAAARASLAAAEDAKRAVENLPFILFLERELAVRQRQASLGVAAAAAALDEAEREAVYAVTRTYFTVLYAREQERLARGVVERLSTIRKAAQQQLEGGARDVTAADVNRTTVYLRLAETRRTQATQGVKRALAALREAIGLGPECDLDVPDVPLPVPEAVPCRGDVIASALARRGGLVQARVFAEVACLEVEAQSLSVLKRVETFASASDIHARQIPQGSSDADYRPGGLPPEMPPLLVGCRADRVQRGQSLAGRAAAVVEVTRNLIALQAEDAFLRWEEAATQTTLAREAAEAGSQLAGELDKDFRAGLKVRVEELVNAWVLASQARAQYHEFLYRQIIALADLKRVTAGGFCAGLVEAVAPRPDRTPSKDREST
jgi:outer membrane protein TolC